jgi:hypothetical protein
MDIDGYNGKLGSGNLLQLAMKHPIFIATDHRSKWAIVLCVECGEVPALA